MFLDRSRLEVLGHGDFLASLCGHRAVCGTSTDLDSSILGVPEFNVSELGQEVIDTVMESRAVLLYIFCQPDRRPHPTSKLADNAIPRI